MSVVLGIDAAWTATQPSGVAVVAGARGRWRCAGVAPSGAAFVALAAGEPVDWLRRPSSGAAGGLAGLLDAARTLAGAPADVIAVDMPIGRSPAVARRASEREVSRRFGARGCATHSPTPQRPGPVGAAFLAALAACGFGVATTAPDATRRRHAIEVYPHVALLALLGRTRRVPYKVAKSARYWPGVSAAERRARLLREMHAIDAAMTARLGPTGLALPEARSAGTLAGLKCHEDALDGLVCAWVGALFVEGEAMALGDETAAIWIPRAAAGVEDAAR